jgi:hypothetical protein
MTLAERVKRIESELKDIKSQLNSGADLGKQQKQCPYPVLQRGGIPGG